MGHPIFSWKIQGQPQILRCAQDDDLFVCVPGSGCAPGSGCVPGSGGWGEVVAEGFGVGQEGGVFAGGGG
jgi:hypothetical protein